MYIAKEIKMLSKSKENIINGEALKFYRKKCNKTQQELADEIKCSKDQVYRWEAGESKKPRQLNINNLTKALNVSWEQLTTQPPQEKDSSDSIDQTFDLKRKVCLSTRTAMGYASKKYAVRWRDILELAPLMFMIFAQQSLKAREKDLDKLKEQIEESAVSINSTIPYMADKFFINSENDWICEERDSIKHNEVFKFYDNEDGEEQSPFVNHLKKHLEELFPSEVDIRPNSHSSPDYSIPIKFLDEIIEISGKDKKNDEAILHRIQEGHYDLQEVLSKKKELDAKAYQSWLENKYQEIEVTIEATEDKLFKGLKL